MQIYLAGPTSNHEFIRLRTILGDLGITVPYHSVLNSLHSTTVFMTHVTRLRLVHRVVELEIERNGRNDAAIFLAAGKSQQYRRGMRK